MRAAGFIDYYGSREGVRFLTRQAVSLIAAAVVLFALFGSTDLDRIITHSFYDTARGGFPLTNEWWLKTVLHDAARTTSTLGVLALVSAAVSAWFMPRPMLAHRARHELAFVAVAALSAVASVAVMKHSSGHACPWDIVEFGGAVPYRHLLAPHGTLAAIQGCFPAAHPLVGYGWLGVAFALYPRAPRWAFVTASATLVAGTGLGIVQVMRGAHFLSHVLWTAWAVWAIDLALLCLFGALGRRPASNPQPNGRRRSTWR
jgi:membrane-associated PAP2 superfamily phosphatase